MSNWRRDLYAARDRDPAARNALEVPVYNYLLNPDGAIYQRTVAASADDTYIDDRWYILTQTATATPSQVSNPEDGYRYALRLTQSQASARLPPPSPSRRLLPDRCSPKPKWPAKSAS